MGCLTIQGVLMGVSEYMGGSDGMSDYTKKGF